jgi:hypothetical protein
MWRRPVLVTLIASACAGPSQEAMAPAPVSRPPSAPTEDVVPVDLPKGTPKEVARQCHNPFVCEYTARKYLSSSADFGWEVLRACVNKGDFIQLRVLLSPPWIDLMKRRPDAPEVLAEVIAARGGDVASDMEFVRKNRIYLFDLAMASKAADRLNGRDVVFLAHVGDGKPKEPGYVLEMSELGLYSEPVEYPVQQNITTHVTTANGGGAYSTASPLLKSGNLEGGYQKQSSRFRTRFMYENFADETGRMIWAKADLSDPFLVPGRDVVVLARLEGVKDLSTPSEEEEPDQRFLVKVLKYWEPSKAMVYRE